MSADREDRMILPRNEARLRAMFENVGDPVILMEAVRDAAGEATDFRYLDINAAARELLGFTRGGFVGRTMSELLGEGGRARLPVWGRVLATGEVERYEAAHRDRVYLVSIFRVDDDALCSVSLDITERRRAEQLLREQEASMRAMIEAMPQMVWLASTSGDNLYNSPSLLAYTGLRAEDIMRDGWMQTIHPDDRAGAIAFWERVVASGEGGTRTHRVRRWDGEHRWFHVAAAPVRDSEGAIVRWIGTWTDVHEAKLSEIALREADEKKSAFLALVSHELRNPLAPIRNAVYLLDRVAPGSVPFERAKAILARQTAHLTRLVEQLLDMSRITHDALPLDRRPLDLGAVTVRAVEHQRATLEAHRLTLSARVPGEPVRVDADEVRLAQVLHNLLDNARKFTPAEGRVDVTLEVAPPRAVLRVRDTGCGIEPARLAAVFSPFARGGSASGLGLGLALVKSLVELHGGAVSVRSEGSDRGTEIVIELPLSPDS